MRNRYTRWSNAAPEALTQRDKRLTETIGGITVEVKRIDSERAVPTRFVPYEQIAVSALRINRFTDAMVARQRLMRLAAQVILTIDDIDRLYVPPNWGEEEEENGS